jgi:hypothetical protein
VADTLEVVDALIVVPKLDDLVVTGGDEVLALLEDGEGVELAGVGAVEQADGLAVVAVPIADLAVGAGRQQL